MMDPHQQSKITPAHLERKAVVYLRQSSERQVLENKESQRLQYALADRSRELAGSAISGGGWIRDGWRLVHGELHVDADRESAVS